MSTKTIQYKPRLKELYNQKLVNKLKTDLSLRNPNQVPKIEKIVVSVGLGKGKDDKKLFEVASNTLRKITGQQPIQTIARKSIAGFKLREGNPIGLKVTLRGDRMYEFLDRLISVVIPRLRDFHGVSIKSFDSQGNYNIGLTEQSIFPELSFEETTNAHGIQVTISIRNENKEHSLSLLKELGMPFEKTKEKK